MSVKVTKAGCPEIENVKSSSVSTSVAETLTVFAIPSVDVWLPIEVSIGAELTSAAVTIIVNSSLEESVPSVTATVTT